MTAMLKIGIDLGGSKIEIIAMDNGGCEILRRRVATPARDYLAILDTIGELVQTTERDLGVRGSVGVGAPGAVSTASGRMKNSNTACLNGQSLKHDLERLLAREIRLANDANCFALSEAIDGAGVGASVVFGVILGTGVGAGIVVDGKIIEGANSIAGEWGHNPLQVAQTQTRAKTETRANTNTNTNTKAEAEADSPARQCYCGRIGCVETWLSGLGFAADHAARHGGALSSEQIAKLADSGNFAATDSMSRYERRLARALASVINILDPEIIVLGGGLSNIDSLYRTLPELLRAHVFSDGIDTRILKNHHGDSGGVRGAAWLWGR